MIIKIPEKGKRIQLVLLIVLFVVLLSGCTSAESESQTETKTCTETGTPIETGTQIETETQIDTRTQIETKSYGIEEWLASITEEELLNAMPVTVTSIEWYQAKVLLLAEFPELQTKIYAPGIEIPYSISCNFILVEHDGDRTLMEMHWDPLRLPRFQSGDFDTDGQQEIAVINCCGRGTGCYQEALSILDSKDKEFDQIYTLDNQICLEAVRRNLSYYYAEDTLHMELTTDSGEVKYSVSGTLFKYLQEQKEEFGKLTYGEWFCYDAADNMQFVYDIIIGYIPASASVSWNNVDEYMDVPDSIPDGVRMNVKYLEDGEFEVYEYRFSKNLKEFE